MNQIHFVVSFDKILKNQNPQVQQVDNGINHQVLNYQ